MSQLNFLNVAAPATPSLKAIKETPARRMAQVGPSALSRLELIAAIVGNPDTALAILNRLPTLADIARASWYDLYAIPGMGPQKTAALKAAVEMGRRLLIEDPLERQSISCPAEACHLLSDMETLEQEQMRVILMDTRNKVINIITLYQGSTNCTMVRVAELFREAIRANAVAIIVAHNHPTGDPSPSPEDVALTKEIVQAGKLVDIEVLDHVVVGRQRFVSLKERGLGFGAKGEPS